MRGVRRQVFHFEGENPVPAARACYASVSDRPRGVPEAQALIDRLAAMDLARPRHDRATIERAINAHLTALGLPERPFIWADDVQTAFLAERAAKPAWDAAVREAGSRAYMAASNNTWHTAT